TCCSAAIRRRARSSACPIKARSNSIPRCTRIIDYIPVIPAKAGIQQSTTLDSRFRGNDEVAETMTATLELTKALIARPSISPDDLGCQELLARELEALGFRVEKLRFGAVDNFWARRGNAGPVLCFAGHTDVVPAGNRADWHSD